METISSRRTFMLKRVFPVLWCGFLAVFVVAGAAGGGMSRQPGLLVMPLLMLAVGVMVFRKLVWDLADEVRDGGDFLVVRRGTLEERLSLANVMNVNISQFTNPRRLTLRLRKPGQFGDEVAFIPRSPFRLNPFTRDPVAEALIQRVDRIRNQG